MDDLHETTKKIEKGILVTVAEKQAADRVIMEHLEELAFLAKTLYIDIQKTFIQKIEHPDKKTYVGSGKLDEIKDFVLMEKIDLIIFDDDL